MGISEAEKKLVEKCVEYCYILVKLSSNPDKGVLDKLLKKVSKEFNGVNLKGMQKYSQELLSKITTIGASFSLDHHLTFSPD